MQLAGGIRKCVYGIQQTWELSSEIAAAQLGLDQAELAEKAGTSRKWLIEVEQGKPRAEIGLDPGYFENSRSFAWIFRRIQPRKLFHRRTCCCHLSRQTPEIDSILNALKKGK